MHKMLNNNHGEEVLDIEIFGMLLRATRRNAHYTQRDLAEKLDVSSITISCWETGKAFSNKKHKMMENILSVKLFDKIYKKLLWRCRIC